MQKKKIYFIGIAGVAMASLAGLLKKMGHDVAGSDQDIYPPMSDMLKSLKINIFSPYNEFHMKQYGPDIVVVGNAIGRGNPELEYAISNGLPYRSMSDILMSEFIEGKKSIVITGTHGKTTTTALTAWILEYAGFSPTVFVGGIVKNFGSTFKLGNGKYVVVEGDEYDTAFFDKGPKFLHYRPFIGLVNNIELDHIDIYKDISEIKNAFGRFINLIPKNGLLAASLPQKFTYGKISENPYKLGLKWAKSPIKTYGLGTGNYTAKNISSENGITRFDVYYNGHFLLDIRTSLIGKHNILNILGAITIAKFLKISNKKICNAIEKFQGVKRRQEIIGEKNGITVIDDYAHHPTAVAETLKAIRTAFHVKSPKSRLVCVFEPGSASSKRRIFEKQYIESFRLADTIYIYKPFHAKQLKKRETFSGLTVSSCLNKLHGKHNKFERIRSWNFTDIGKMLLHMKHELRVGDVIVIMSCRGFDGLYKQIWNILP